MTREEQIIADRMFGLISRRDAGRLLGQTCPDPDAHERLYAGSEWTWRKTAAQVAADHVDGCAWCGGKVPVPLPGGVEGHVIVGRRG